MTEIEKEIAALTARIDARGADADALYHRGMLYWKLGRRGAAMSDYAAAAAIDPASPAAAALEQARSIMDFYDRNLYNP